MTSKRAKEILMILTLLPSGRVSRYHLVYLFEKENWIKKTRPSPKASWRVPLDSVRVSYDRTLFQLEKKGLIERCLTESVLKSPYHYLWEGQVYRVTEKGRIAGKKFLEEVQRETIRLNELIMNFLDDPRDFGRDLTPRCPYCRKKLEKSEVVETPAEAIKNWMISTNKNPHELESWVYYTCTKCGKTFGLYRRP